METWEVWFPAAAANGLLVARARVDPAQVMWLHAAPEVVAVVVREGGEETARSRTRTSTRATAVPPMTPGTTASGNRSAARTAGRLSLTWAHSYFSREGRWEPSSPGGMPRTAVSGAGRSSCTTTSEEVREGAGMTLAGPCRGHLAGGHRASRCRGRWWRVSDSLSGDDSARGRPGRLRPPVHPAVGLTNRFGTGVSTSSAPSSPGGAQRKLLRGHRLRVDTTVMEADTPVSGGGGGAPPPRRARQGVHIWHMPYWALTSLNHPVFPLRDELDSELQEPTPGCAERFSAASAGKATRRQGWRPAPWVEAPAAGLEAQAPYAGLSRRRRGWLKSSDRWDLVAGNGRSRAIE